MGHFQVRKLWMFIFKFANCECLPEGKLQQSMIGGLWNEGSPLTWSPAWPTGGLVKVPDFGDVQLGRFARLSSHFGWRWTVKPIDFPDIAMSSRLPLGFFALLVILHVWQMRNVFVGHPVSPQQRCRIQVAAAPMAKGSPLMVGALVGYELNVPANFMHTGIYLGPGCAELEHATGCSNLQPDMHYVIEYSGPTRFSGSPQSSRESEERKRWPKHLDHSNGSFNWMVCIWDVFATVWSALQWSRDLPNAVRKGKVSSHFGGYDVLRNNCQHFAVWARYGIKAMLLGDEGKGTVARHLADMAAFTAAGIAGFTVGVMGVWALCGVNLLTAKTGTMMSTRLTFK